MKRAEAIEEAVEILRDEREQASKNGNEEYANFLLEVIVPLTDVTTQVATDTTTDPRFWDCNCDEVYIHSKSIDTHCPLCKADAMLNGSPDARVLEIAQGGKFATDDSWLHAYNLEEYYDSLDWYDTHRYNGAEVASIEAIIIFRKQERA